jgi:hypothetical protein
MDREAEDTTNLLTLWQADRERCQLFEADHDGGQFPGTSGWTHEVDFSRGSDPVLA